MSQTRTLRREEWPALYQRIRFDPLLESRGLARLADLDLDGCRAAFAKLVDELDFSSGGPVQREVVALLLDLLLAVNARVFRASTTAASHHAQRAALIERFAAYDDPEDARHAFVPALNRLLAALRPPAADGPPMLVERAQAYVEEHYQRRISLSTLAGHLHVSPHYLSRLFHQETGSTLTAYIHRVRLDHARVLLAAGTQSISEIAYLVGYQNYRDFYRNFVKYERSSPRQVRRRLLSGSQEPPAGRPGVPVSGDAR